MAGGVIFAELHVFSGEQQESSDLVGVATSPVLSLFKRRRGQLFTVIEPNLPEGEGLCRRLIETIEDEYFRDSSRSVTTALRQALTLANERLRSENSNMPPDKQLRIGLSCAVIREGEAYIAQVAPANAFVLHGGSVKRIFSTYSVIPDTSDNGTNRASDSLGTRLDTHINLGYSPLQEGDLVVLASGAYWKLIPDRYILDAAKHLDPEIAASELYGYYTAHSRRPTTSVIVIRVSDLPARQRGPAHEKKKEPRPAALMEMAELVTEPLSSDSRSRSRNSRAREKSKPSGQPSLWERLRPRVARKKAPLYPPGPPLQVVGKPSVKLKQQWSHKWAVRGGPSPWIGRLLLMLVLAALFVALGNTAVSFFRSWQLGDPTTLVQEAQQKRTMAATAENQTSARALLAESYELLGRAIQAKDEPSTRATAASVLGELDRMDQVVRVNQTSVVVDYSPIAADKGDITQLMVEGNNLYVLDEGLDRIYSYVLTAEGKGVQEPGKHQVLVKRGDRLDGGVVGDLLSLVWMPPGQLRSSPALFALESGRSIIGYDPKAGLSRLEVAESQRWGSIQAINGFAGGLYLLDTKLKSVYYYPPTKNGYESNPYTIVDSRSKADLSKAVDIALDGNLYVLEGSGTVRRFNRDGRPLDFSQGLLDGPIKGPKALYASANTRSLYLLDSAGERILQFSQEGKLQRQFKAGGKAVSFQDLRDIYVDEAGRKLYALARKSLFVFQMPPLE